MTDSAVTTVDADASASTWNATDAWTTAEPWGNTSLSTAQVTGSAMVSFLDGDDALLTTAGADSTTMATLMASSTSNQTLDNVTELSAMTTWAGRSTVPAGTPSIGEAVEVAVVPAVFMTFFTFLTLVGNLCCLVALTNKKLEKSMVMYSFLTNACTVQLCDGILSMPLVLGVTLVGFWPYGVFMCQLNAFVLNLINVQTILALALLALDRMLAIRLPSTYSNMNKVKAILITGYAWLHGMAFTLFIIAGVIPVEYLPDYYLCCLSSATGLVYLIFFSLLCYGLPLLVISMAFVVIVRVAVKEKPTVQNFNAEVNYARRLGRRSKLWRELRGAKVVGTLVLLWCFLEGPYLALRSVELFGNLESLGLSVPASLKTTLTWLRFCYPWAVPAIIFVGFPEVRKEHSNACTCPKKNMVDSGRQEILVSPGVRTSWASASEASTAGSRPSTLGRSFQVPVLFATSGGLRLQVGNRQRENDVDRAGDLRDGFQPDPRLKYDPSRSRYPPPLAPVIQSSDEETDEGWDVSEAVACYRDDEGVENGVTGPRQANGRPASATAPISPEPADNFRSPASSISSSFQLSLTSRELKVHQGTPRSPPVSPRQPDPDTPPGSMPPSQANTPR